MEARAHDRGLGLGWAIGVATVEEIDRINIYHASHLAMIRALEGLGRAEEDHVLVDGNHAPKGLKMPGRPRS